MELQSAATKTTADEETSSTFPIPSSFGPVYWKEKRKEEIIATFDVAADKPVVYRKQVRAFFLVKTSPVHNTMTDF